ncbi:hypothetical protein [Aquimarina mytili]|uniref:Uncharacterized protein n=1 Tax=Aquimarina mytili TaxID=874423 RepID=A0A937D8D9_9FLAO|nr:hypothetical protein [Aquimarina mytili]MBL0683965.1 hypothetical protein [Aquimarina mytili]
MLQSILKLNGIKELKKEAQKSVNGGLSDNEICPSAGERCCSRFVLIPCFGGVVQLDCVNGIWVEV